MKVQDVMTASVETVRPETPFKEVVETLLRGGISGVPVIDEHDQVLGIVTEGDLLGKEAYGGLPRQGFLGRLFDLLSAPSSTWLEKARALTADELMTSPAVTIGPEDTLRAAARRMSEYRVKRLPVVEDGRLVGIVSRSDILSVYDRSDAELQLEIADLLVRCLYVPPEHDVHVAVTEGVVRLSGEVQHESDVRVAAAIVAAADGVVGVDNELRFRERDVRRPR